jgi:DNA mismatch endonuclease (patch repair protein)
VSKQRDRPTASSTSASDRMRSIRQEGTRKELEIRSALHRLGLRFRVQSAPIKGLRRRADVIFRSEQVAIFVDGCFWHGCPIHRSLPKSNAEWWRSKLEKNIQRDEDTNIRFREAGWLVLRFWEHEDVDLIARDIERIVRARRVPSA